MVASFLKVTFSDLLLNISVSLLTVSVIQPSSMFILKKEKQKYKLAFKQQHGNKTLL